MDSPVLAPPAVDSGGALAPLEFDPRHRVAGRLGRLYERVEFPLAVYLATRVLFLVIAIIDSVIRGWPIINAGSPFLSEVTNWDGMWYVRLAVHGYPHHYIAGPLPWQHYQTTLGFFPLFSMAIWVVWHALFLTPDEAGLLISIVGGFAGVVLLQQLARQWWDEAAGRRVVLFVCLFPGSIVFSMAYSEGILIPLAAGCLLALAHRRWLIAGVCAALCTAVGPIGLAIVPACMVAAGRELYLRGWWRAKGSLIAPILAPAGVVAFAAFLWSWTGTPLASYKAQRYGWNEKSSILAIPHDISKAFYELIGHTAGHRTLVNLNYYSGVIGAIFLLVGLWLMLRPRDGARRIPWPAIAWTLWVAVLTLTSWNTPPNPRMLLCAFPVLMVYAARLKGLAFGVLLGASTILLIAMSFETFVGYPLRP
jgi:hypothetical protein